MGVNDMQLRLLERAAIKAVAFIMLAAVALAGCTPNAEEKNLQAIRVRGEQFLSLLRAQEWQEAAEMVLLNDAAYRRFNFPKQGDPVTVRNEIARLFRQVYSNVKPGPLVSVRINPRDPTLASIAYRHVDLDSFNMRLFDGQWYYAFE
ncbi:MAG: hypothetical protein OEM67_02635 [Thermoleophilia bacterium]|nr:hypothetical protein [Thermoleophilia bacterium]